MAVTMVPEIIDAASGVAAPAVRSAPPSASETPAAVAWRCPVAAPGPARRTRRCLPGRGCRTTPNSFYVPWPTKSGPTTPRIASVPSFMSASKRKIACWYNHRSTRGQGVSNTAWHAARSGPAASCVTIRAMGAGRDDDDDWVGTPPEGHYTRDRAKPEFWRGQRPIVPAAVGMW